MKTWSEKWDAATVEDKKVSRYWRPGFSKDVHRNGMRGDRNQCPACGELFNSSSAFEKHRTGPFTGRRCLTVPEMLAKGYEKNAGHWWTRGGNPFYSQNADNPGAE